MFLTSFCLSNSLCHLVILVTPIEFDITGARPVTLFIGFLGSIKGLIEGDKWRGFKLQSVLSQCTRTITTGLAMKFKETDITKLKMSLIQHILSSAEVAAGQHWRSRSRQSAKEHPLRSLLEALRPVETRANESSIFWQADKISVYTDQDTEIGNKVRSRANNCFLNQQLMFWL